MQFNHPENCNKSAEGYNDKVFQNKVDSTDKFSYSLQIAIYYFFRNAVKFVFAFDIKPFDSIVFSKPG